MKLIKALEQHFDITRWIIKDTIKTIYPYYYPQGAVDFFIVHHSDDALKTAIIQGEVYLMVLSIIFRKFKFLLGSRFI